jgi:hypothetical protein
VTVCVLDTAPDDLLAGVAGELADAPGLLGVLATAGVPNRYPRLPIRDDHAVVWLQTAEEPAAAPARLIPHLAAEPQSSRLLPTTASLMPSL